MKRKGEHVKGKGLVAALLAGSMLLAGSLAYFSPGRVWAKETGEAAVDTETAETETEALVTSYSMLANTETKKVDESTASIAQAQVYKNLDYTFLQNYKFGETNEAKAKITFSSVQELQKSNDPRLKDGNIIKTEGYYNSGDGGSAVYKVLSETEMKNQKLESGSVRLVNGLYACIIPDIYEIDGKNWVIVSAKQFGASGDGIIASENGINAAASYVSDFVAQNDDIFRGLEYIPSGEYKCTNEIPVSNKKDINIVGDGDSTVLFTDNDYRAEQGYSEFFFSLWNSENIYFGDFRIEAREVDLYNYMRQFVLVYCDNIYIYQVDMIIPQETYSAYYFEDKQYSNFCCYSGNTNVTVDACTMVQFSGTYRGANVGVMDFWNRPVANITIMNCDLYSNARDEQIGIFNIAKTGSAVNENTSITNVDIINNNIHTVPVKYTEIIGNQNMCFTVSYTDSVRIDDIRIAGNHFICQADSKFMTFGNLTNCVFEENIIELITTRTNGATVFDSGNENPENIIIRNNEFFLTSADGKQGKYTFLQGEMSFEGNKVFSDTIMPVSIIGKVAKNNEFVFLKSTGSVCSNVEQLEGNTFYLYAGTTDYVFDLSADALVKGNTVYDYKRSIGSRGPWDALVKINGSGSKETVEFCNNTYYAPNRKYTTSGQYKIAGVNGVTEEEEDVDWIDDNGSKKITCYYNRLFYLRGPDDTQTALRTVTFQNNTLQGVKGYTGYGNRTGVEYTLSGNTTLPYREDISEDELLVSSVDILYNNQKTTEISVMGDSVALDKIVRIAQRDDEENILSESEVFDKEIKWYTSVESMASVNENGVVTRHLYGDVKVYAVPTDGSGIYGECTIHFLKNQATEVTLAKKSIQLQPGLKYYADYTVLPEEASQNLKWTSSDETVASVSSTGLITGNSVGKAVITGSTTDGSNISASISVEVTPVTVKKMVMDNTWLYFSEEEIGTSRQLAIKSYTPENATNKEVKRWESTDTSVASVDSQGNVTVVGSGLAQIKAYSMDEYCYAVCDIFVQPSMVANFTANTIGKDSVSFSWDYLENCYGYYIYQWDNTDSSWKVLNSKYLDKSVTSYKVSNLDADTEYKFCIRSFYSNWLTGERQVYESKDSIITVKTFSHQPVSSILGDNKKDSVFTLIGTGEDKRGTFNINYSPYTDNYSNLDFSYQIEDESIAKVAEVYAGDKSGEIKIVIEGLKCGMTALTVTSNDEAHYSVQIPVGVVTAAKVSNCTADAVYKKITVEFTGLEDESVIDGYFIQLVSGYSFVDVGFIEKSGAGIYNYVDKNVIVGENGGPRKNGYIYVISPCVTDGVHYSIGNGVKSNGESAVFVPEPVKAVSMELKEKTYIVAGGNTIQVSAEVGNEDVSTNELYWEVVNERYASVERQEKQDGEPFTDYAEITGIDAGVTKIKAVTTDGSDIEALAELIVTPQAVKNIKTESELTGIRLSWTDIKNADGYNIYRWDEGKQDFQRVSEVEDNCFDDMDLEQNTTYRYKIAAYMYVDKVKYEGQSTQEISVATAQYDYGIHVTGYQGYYDGNSHAAVTLEGVKEATDTVTYSSDNKNWSSQMPTVKDVKDSRNIYVKVERTGLNQPYEVTVAAAVLAVSIDSTDISLKKSTVEWDGKNHKPDIISETCILGSDYVVSGIKSYKNIGTYAIKVEGIGNYTGTKELSYSIDTVKGHKYKVSGYVYKVTGSKTVSVTGVTNKKKSTITVKNTIKIGGKTYKVTAINANAFKNCKKLKKVTIGKYVTSIGKNAFYGDKKLKKIIIKTKVLKKVGKNAFKGISRTAQIQVPKSKKSKYKNLLKKTTGYVSTMKIK